MYIAKETRYDNMKYNYCGASGLKLPAVSLGLWHNFGSNGNFDTMMDMSRQPLITVSHISIWRIIMAHMMALLRRILARS